MLKIDEPILFE